MVNNATFDQFNKDLGDVLKIDDADTTVKFYDKYAEYYQVM